MWVLGEKIMRFTKKGIEGIEPTDKRQVFFDALTTGLALRVSPAGRKTFYFTYRQGKGRMAEKKWIMLGVFPSMGVEQARDAVRQKSALVAGGIDPVQEMRNEKAAPSTAALLHLFLEEHVGAKLKPATQKHYRALVENIISPAVGKMKIEDVTHRHIARLHHSLRDTPYQANRAASVLHKFFAWCEANGYRERATNPVQGLEKYREFKRTQFMGREELERIGTGLAVLESRKGIDLFIAAALKVLLFTGGRCGEVLTLKWEYVDMEHGLAHLPDSKTGAKVLHLPPPALAVLGALPRLNDYCFPGRYGRGHVVNVKDTWKRVLEAGGVEGWRIHDLRHAFASYAANSGKSLPVIGKILGHTQAATTARYAHLAENPVAQAAAETAVQLQKDLSGGKVLPFQSIAVGQQR